jgi:hypothetical protein
VMVPASKQLRQFRVHLQHFVGADERLRPFICEGNPYDCRAFLVGINPASQEPLWEFWSDDAGFDKAAWLVRYKSLRQSERLKSERNRPLPVSVTRRRIELFVQAARPARVLETNLYGFPTPSERGLRKPDRDVTAFEFLLSEIGPNVLVLHGSVVRLYFEHRYDCSLKPMFSKVVVNGRAIWVAAARHSSLVSFRIAEQLGTEVRLRSCAL